MSLRTYTASISASVPADRLFPILGCPAIEWSFRSNCEERDGLELGEV